MTGITPGHGDGMTATTPHPGLRAARAPDSPDKRQRVLAAIAGPRSRREPVTALPSPAAARVSTWLVYAEGVREHIEAVRRARPAASPAPRTAIPPARGEPATQASLRTDLALAREEIRRLRAERDKLRAAAPPPARRRDRRT